MHICIQKYPHTDRKLFPSFGSSQNGSQLNLFFDGRIKIRQIKHWRVTLPESEEKESKRLERERKERGSGVEKLSERESKSVCVRVLCYCVLLCV